MRIRRFFVPLFLVAVAGLAIAALYSLDRLTPTRRSGAEGTSLGDIAPLTVDPLRADGRRWFVGEAMLASGPDNDARRADGSPTNRSAFLHVVNPGTVRASVVVRIHTAAAPPRGIALEVGAGALTTLDLAARDDIPRDTPSWIVVEADVPVFAQCEVADHRAWDPVPTTLSMPLPQRVADIGWVFPDGFQGGTESWHEDETISLLNTASTDGQAQVTYRFRDGRDARTQTMPIAAGRVAVIDVWRAFAGTSPTNPLVVSGDYAVLVTADRPVVAQQTRRARWRGLRDPEGIRVLAPIQVALAQRTREWFYAGGWTRRLPVLPRDNYADRTWHLLFTHNLGTAPQSVEVEGVLTQASGQNERVDFEVAQERSDLQWLHASPWRERLGEEIPWGLRLRSAGAIAPSVTNAEFEPWSQAMPGAMGASALVAGPLDGHREWWLGVARHGGRDDRADDWHAGWQVMNPGTAPLTVSLRALGVAPPVAPVVIDVAPGTVRRVTGDEWPGLPTGVPFVVVATADQAFVAHAWLRVSARGVAGTRALASSPGVPMALLP